MLPEPIYTGVYDSEYHPVMEMDDIAALFEKIADKKKKNQEKRRAQKHKADRFKRRVYKNQNGLCYYCLKKFGINQLTKDHVVPLSKGGTNAVKNIVLACKKCNNTKSDMSLEEFMATLYKGS
jgi:5-methylcytosine-specific restriction endonuclease McrA